MYQWVVRVEGEFDVTVGAENDEDAENKVRQALLHTFAAADIYSCDVIDGPILPKQVQA